ncbi:ammonium transporter family domain-containing protein [Ditylenchus destructor]|nr:ammonium transporter family domain-containing protein [Ditylenchus destructor]
MSAVMDDALLLQQVAGRIAAMKEELLNSTRDLNQNENAFFLCSMALLIFLMQTGFAFLEAGAVRGKNCTNILAKNLLDSLITIIGYWSIGWAFAYGANPISWLSPFVGLSEFAGVGLVDHSRFFFQYVFAARASTIISGAVAERCEFFAFIVYSIVVSSTVYPVLAHWGWSDQGWLKQGIQFDQYTTTYLVRIVIFSTMFLKLASQ